jgi:hypothetical protein
MIDLVAADFGIRQLHARFADAVWRQDGAAFGACFASNGVWKIAGQEFVGAELIGTSCAALLGRCTHIHLVTSQPILGVDGDTVIGRLSMTEFARMNDGSTAMTIGWYHDRYIEEGGLWRFARRHWSFKYRGAPDLTGFFADTPNYGAFPDGPTPDEATFVRPVA